MYQNAETPDVAGCVVALLLQHLRCDVHGSVAGCCQQAVFSTQLLSKTEITNTNCVCVTCMRNKYSDHQLQLAQCDIETTQWFCSLANIY
jgi:hypothetical protein